MDQVNTKGLHFKNVNIQNLGHTITHRWLILEIGCKHMTTYKNPVYLSFNIDQ